MVIVGDLWIKGGTIVTSERMFPGDVVIRSGRIEAVVERPGVAGGRGEESGSATVDPSKGTGMPVLDVAGKWVLPGLIDVHVHFREPGLTHKEDFSSGTLAAAWGGVTTVLDMPNTLPPVADAAALRDKAASVRNRAYVDYGVYGLIDEHNLSDLPAMADAGAAGFKLFLGPTTGDLRAPGWGRLLEVFKQVKEIGLPLVIHAEDRDVIAYWTDRVRSGRPDGRGSSAPARAGGSKSPRNFAAKGSVEGGYADFLATRPRFGEVAATQTACLLAQMTETPVHIAHVALKEAVDVLRQAKAAGAPVTAETCPPYLTMTASDCDALGPVSKILPPIRDAADRDALWAGLYDGTIDLIATDHAPHEAAAKTGGWMEAAGGMVGVETMLPVLMNEVHGGRLTPRQLVQWTSRGPAEIFGLHRKGDLHPGRDGDVVVVDPDAVRRIEPERLHGKSINSALLGTTLRGAVLCTVLRGHIVVKDGKSTANPGGVMVRRQRK